MERRAGNRFKPEGRKLVGYAATFNQPTDLGEFVEVIRPGAFARSLAADSSKQIRAIYEHDGKSLLARLGAGTLRLREDNVGLAFELDLPDTTVGRDLAELVKRGDVAGCSFGFMPVKDGWSHDHSKPLRELRDVDLIEITITASPAYDTTSVEVRTKPLTTITLARRYLEACR